MDSELPPDPFLDEYPTEEISDEVAAARAEVIDAWGEFVTKAGACIKIDRRCMRHPLHWGWAIPSAGFSLEMHQHAGPNTLVVIAEIPMEELVAKLATEQGDNTDA